MLENILNTVFLNNSIENYLYAMGTVVGLFFIFRIFSSIAVGFLREFFKKTTNNFDDLLIDIISNISKFFYWFVSFYFGIKFLTTPVLFISIINKLFIIIIAYEIIIASQSIIDYFVEKFSKKKDNSSKAVFSAAGKFVKWTIWLITLLMILSNFGINITALAAGFGIGGIAIAFAIQGILKDLFSYFTILLDKPIRVGDYIYFSDKKGTVKNIGLRTTRLEAVDGEEIIIANELVTGADFRNFGKTKDRRAVYHIGAAYDTPIKTLKSVKEELIKIVKSFDNVDFRRCHLKNMGDSSLEYEIVYHIKTRDYELYMDINEEINFKILELFKREGVEIPFPTRTVYNRQD